MLFGDLFFAILVCYEGRFMNHCYQSAQQYFNNEELTQFLSDRQRKYPNFIQLETIGTSSMGEPIILVTLTDHTIKHHSEKPAFWIDANIHASEVTGTQGVCHFIEVMLDEKHPDRQKHYELLKKMTYYLIPRFSPDGARAFFLEKNSCRSTPLAVPYESDNFQRRDLDGDGEITLMRWKDPAGPFKELEGYPGVLVPRKPSDFCFQGQTFYQVLPEGVWKTFDAFNLAKNYDMGFDFNRQAPSFFLPEGLQKGAGQIPFQFPETRAIADAIRKRKNIFAASTYHTYGGFIVKTPANVPESDCPIEDMLRNRVVADLLGEKTGYTVHSGLDDFVYVPGQPLPGTFDEWYYMQLGIVGMTVEFWDIWKQSGMNWKKAVEKYESLDDDNMKKLIRWAEANLEKSDYFKEWTKINHPQLGDVEIGGFKTAFFITNPPVKFLSYELEKVTNASLHFSMMAPLVEIKDIAVTKTAGVSIIDMRVCNKGYFPSCGSQRALDIKIIENPSLKIATNGVSILSGPTSKEITHLSGYSDGLPRVSPFFGNHFSYTYEQNLRWIVEGRGEIKIEIDYFKGGLVQSTINI